MTQKPALTVVDAAPETAAAAPAKLSAAREAVARAIAWRAEAVAAVQAASDAHGKAERLVAAPDQAKARIAEVKAANADIVERWATGGAVGAPELTGTTEEMEKLERELAEAERLAAAARAALPSLSQRIENAQASATAALAAVREAVAAVLAEEAEAFIAQIRSLEKQAATLRASYQGAINTLHRLGLSHRVGGSEAQRLRLATPAPITFTDPFLQNETARWSAFAEELITNKGATLEAPEIK